MANSTLSKAKADKKDEFYTQFYDIEAEMEAYLDYNPDVFRGKRMTKKAKNSRFGLLF